MKKRRAAKKIVNVRKKKPNVIAAAICLLAFVIGASFLSFNITGNAIGNVSSSGNGIIGVVLVIIGIFAGLFAFNRR